jgi:hypothetical protein
MTWFALGFVLGMATVVLWAMWPELRSEAQWVEWGR